MAKFKNYEISSQYGGDDDGDDIIWIDIYEVIPAEHEYEEEEGLNICTINKCGEIEYSKNENWKDYMDDLELLETIIESSNEIRKKGERINVKKD